MAHNKVLVNCRAINCTKPRESTASRNEDGTAPRGRPLPDGLLRCSIDVELSMLTG